jgi:leucyl-tRNA synthetase
MFILVSAPAAKDFEFKQSGITGIHRFLTKVYGYGASIRGTIPTGSLASYLSEGADPELVVLIQLFNAGLKDMAEYKFNTAVSYAIKIFNTIAKLDSDYAYVAFRELLKFIQPMAPHLTHYLWKELVGGELLQAPYPRYIEAATASQSIMLQINGKVVGKFTSKAPSKEAATAYLKELGAYKKLVLPKITRVIWVPGKICNFIIYENNK